ncbi:hypothetical protein [Streptomyces echinatus]|uniref:hypothetical protein n=1 Tax=Streptomyces echinatus TaxID=67293 RepID=UPI0037A0EB8D
MVSSARHRGPRTPPEPVLLRCRVHAEGGRLAGSGPQSPPARVLRLTQTEELFTTGATGAAGSDAVPAA